MKLLILQAILKLRRGRSPFVLVRDPPAPLPEERKSQLVDKSRGDMLTFDCIISLGTPV